MPSEEVLRGKIYSHDEGHLRYCVLDLLLDMTNYEVTGIIGKKVIYYMQLDEGTMPVGTTYSRTEEDFKQNFTLESQS